jgi:hypothetical protein
MFLPKMNGYFFVGMGFCNKCTIFEIGADCARTVQCKFFFDILQLQKSIQNVQIVCKLCANSAILILACINSKKLSKTVQELCRIAHLCSCFYCILYFHIVIRGLQLLFSWSTLKCTSTKQHIVLSQS